jgi:hypothetical protein
MKKAFTFLLVLLAFCATAYSQNVRLILSPKLGLAPFALNTPVSAGTYDYQITRLEYYLSNIRITHDGGQETNMTDLYLLVRPAADSVYDLGAYPGITNVESISISIGIDQAHNHLDPSTYPVGYPLAFQNPSMHWGWAGGYRFAALEGLAGSSFENVFEVHGLGDQNYKSFTVSTMATTEPNGDRTIRLNADYTRLLDGIDVSQGLISHGTIDEAATLLYNMGHVVFSAQTTATTDPLFEGSFRLSPNPATSEKAMATMILPSGFAYHITLSDLSGKTILNRQVAAGATSFSLESRVVPGVYFVQLWQNERPVAVEKLVVTQ